MGNKVYHGGCLQCPRLSSNQKICPKCCYFKPNWDLPDLSQEGDIKALMVQHWKSRLFNMLNSFAEFSIAFTFVLIVLGAVSYGLVTVYGGIE